MMPEVIVVVVSVFRGERGAETIDAPTNVAINP
jgi:hypothetical protein